jgi:DNA-binding MarR family transcriptional regulator
VAGPASPPPESLHVADRLHSAVIHLLRSVRARDRALGIGPAKLSVLSVLVFGGSRSIAALARAEQVRLPTMSRLVAALERDGLATRAPDPLDRRASIVTATALGRRMLRRGRERRVTELAKHLTRLEPADFEAIDHASRAIAQLVADWHTPGRAARKRATA